MYWRFDQFKLGWQKREFVSRTLRRIELVAHVPRTTEHGGVSGKQLAHRLQADKTQEFHDAPSCSDIR
jgi:hypothetical protein